MNRPPEPRTGASPEKAPARTPAIWAVAGGKGGVGRSLLVANMGIQIARLGKKVTVADLDFEGANLHTYLGIGAPAKSLEELGLEKGESPLTSLLLDTSVSGLKLLSGPLRPVAQSRRGRILERFTRQADGLGVDLILVDCGSGRGDEVLELFRRAGGGILVATPEPASVESVFLFMESFLEKSLRETLSADDLEKLDIARSLDEGSSGGFSSFRAALERLRAEGENSLVDRVLGALAPLRLRLILNQVRGESDSEIAPVLQSGLEKYFGLEMTSLGCVEYDLSVLQAVQKRKPLSQQYPNSPATQGIERAVSSLIGSAPSSPSGTIPLHRNLGEIDHYRMLEVAPGASSREIQAGYQILKRAYDPEYTFRHPLLSSAQIERIAAQLEAAYRTLIFLESRTEYDRRLVSAGVLAPEQIRSSETETVPAKAALPAGAESVSQLPVSARDDAGKPASPDAGGAPEKVPGNGLPVTGSTLREYREEKRLSLETIVEKTKIRPAILEALEEDRFGDLPEPVFLRGFLRQLAVCLGLDPGVICREYMRRLEPEVPEGQARTRP